MNGGTAATSCTWERPCQFVPTAQPDRAEIPPRPDLAPVVAAYSGQVRVSWFGPDSEVREVTLSAGEPVLLPATVHTTQNVGDTELLGATEIRVAGASAKFGISEVKWSLYPMGGSAVRIPRQIPYTVACELLLTGEHITAQRALDLGLIGHVVPDGEALAKAKEIGHVIGDYSAPLAVKALLRTLRETNGMEEAEALFDDCGFYLRSVAARCSFTAIEKQNVNLPT